jgi:hypothetical protein
LRYLPTDAHATLGLARAFARDGHNARALVLLQRAAEQSADAEPLYSEVQLELGRLMAGSGSDLGLAIARVRRVNGAPHLVVPARGLEARWRSMLGDQAGASLAFARMRDAVELAQTADGAWSEWLLEAGRWARQAGDLLAAERYLVTADRVRPNLREVREARQLLAKELVRTAHEREEPRPEPEPEPGVEPGAHSEPDEDRELRADRLQRELIGTGRLPDADFKTLVADLLELRRGPELHALLMGRYEDASATDKVALQPLLGWALERLAELSSSEGAYDEAELYRAQLELIQSA